MHEQLDLLRREFEADQGTFLLGLRGEGLEWDKAAFSRFEKAMRWACEHFQDEDRLDRWMAEGSHYASWLVRDWTSHPHFPRPEPEQSLLHLDRPCRPSLIANLAWVADSARACQLALMG